VLLMIGTNDVYSGQFPQAEMPQRLSNLIDKIAAAAPDALIVVTKIAPLNNSGWNQIVDTYNAAILELVIEKAMAGKHVVLGDANTGFTPSMLTADNIHPNKSGYDFIGDMFYGVIEEYLP
jgi:lysophospholipase L1-like esterase